MKCGRTRSPVPDSHTYARMRQITIIGRPSCGVCWSGQRASVASHEPFKLVPQPASVAPTWGVDADFAAPANESTSSANTAPSPESTPAKGPRPDEPAETRGSRIFPLDDALEPQSAEAFSGPRSDSVLRGQCLPRGVRL